MTEVAIAASALNRMLDLGRPQYVSGSRDPEHGQGSTHPVRRPMQHAAVTVVLMASVPGRPAMVVQASTGSAASICARCPSKKAGSFSAVPSSLAGSSTSKPGMSVAISNSTRPGSRKYTERK